MPFALMLDDKKKIFGQIKTEFRSAHINLTSTEEESTFLENLQKRPPDVVLMTYRSFDFRAGDLKNFLCRIRDENPGLPALLLVPGGSGSWKWRGLQGMLRERLFDVVRCEPGFVKEVTIRASRLLEFAKSSHNHKPVTKSERSSDQGVSVLFKHLVPQLHNPKTGRIDAAKVSEMFAVPLNHVAEMLNAKAATVHKTPDASALQEKLGQLERIAAGLLNLAGSQERLRMWLKTPNQDLDGKIPLDLLRDRRAEVVENLLEDVLLGQPG